MIIHYREDSQGNWRIIAEYWSISHSIKATTPKSEK